MAIQTVKNTIGGGYVVTLMDGTVLHVPNDPANRHFQEVQDWIALGNTPDPADPPPGVDKISPLTSREIEEMLVAKGVVTSADVTAKKNART